MPNLTRLRVADAITILGPIDQQLATIGIIAIEGNHLVVGHDLADRHRLIVDQTMRIAPQYLRQLRQRQCAGCGEDQIV